MSFQILSTRTALFAASTMLVWSMACAAHADDFVYKYTGQDGVTVYSQTLPESYSPGNVQTVKIETLPIEQKRAAVRMLDALQKKSNSSAAGRSTKLDIADQNIAAAIKNLQRAELSLQNGSVPVGGDRVANIGGGTRLRESYFSRLSRLQSVVEQAKLALDQAYTERNNLR